MMDNLFQDDCMSDDFQDSYRTSFNYNGKNVGNNPVLAKKRKLNSGMDFTEDQQVIYRRTFLSIHAGGGVYATEDWHRSTSALFLPVLSDTYLNVSKYDQITVSQGSFFTADDSGKFSESLMGHVIHLWRYNKDRCKLYIALSYLFTNDRDFMKIQSQLQNI